MPDTMSSNPPPSSNRWIHVIYGAAFLLVLHFLVFVLIVLGVLQLLAVILMGERSEGLATASAGAAAYLRQVVRYIGFVDNAEKPFPIGAWPDEERQS